MLRDIGSIRHFLQPFKLWTATKYRCLLTHFPQQGDNRKMTSDQVLTATTRSTIGQTENMERHEGHFYGKYNDELYFQTWSPNRASASSMPKAVIITHGIGEHSECYGELAQDFVQHGWQVFAWDLRGHGRSSGKRGYLKSFRDYTDDLGLFIEHLLHSQKLTSSFAVLGHSMGGLITLKYALDRGTELLARAVVLSSPLLGIAVPVPTVKELASKFLLRVAPGLTLFNEINYEQLTHDTEILKNYARDSLRHEKICSALYDGMLSTIANVSARGSEMKKPLLVQAAGHDMIVSLSQTEKFYETVASLQKKMIVYKEDFHEIYNELNRKLVYSDLQAFLNTEFKT